MATKRKRRAAPRKVVVVSKTKHRPRRRVSGTAAVGKTTRRRRRSVSGVGKTHRHPRRRVPGVGKRMNLGTLTEIGKMAFGATAGVAANNLILYPGERMLVEKVPMAAKGMGIAQAILGGVIALRSKGNMGRAFGLTILGGGAQSIVRTFNLGAHIPGISGPNDEFMTTRIPISGGGELRSLVAGILQSNDTPNLPMVARSRYNHPRYHSGADRTESGASHRQDARMKSYVGEEWDGPLPAKNIHGTGRM